VDQDVLEKVTFQFSARTMQTVEIVIDGRVVARESIDTEHCDTLVDKLRDVCDSLEFFYTKSIPRVPWGWQYAMETRPAKEGEFRAGYEGSEVFAVAGPCAIDCRIIQISDGVTDENSRTLMIQNAVNNRERIKRTERCLALSLVK
jgi:hypothetical protein